MYRNLFVCIFIISTAFSGQYKKSAIVIDYTDKKKVLFEEKADDIRYPASLTKMMTVYILLETIKKNKIKYNTKFKTSKLAASQSPSKLNLKPGDTITVKDIIKALLVKSANDVAVVAAEGVAGSVDNFCKLMNQKCKKLGLKKTHFVNSSGLPNSKQVTCARDMAKLGMALYRDFPQHWHLFSSKSFTHNKITHQTHCKILKWYNGADGAKTGYIAASGFNLMVTAAMKNNQGKQKRMFVVVMGGDSSKSRDMYAAELMDKYFKGYKPFKQDNNKLLQTNKNAKNSLRQQISKSEMLDTIVHYDDEIFINTNDKIPTIDKKFIDDLYLIDDELIQEDSEIFISAK